LIKVKIK